MEEDCLNEFTLSHLLVDLLNPVAKTIASNGCDLPPSNTTSSPLMPISFGKTCPKLRNIRSRILLENTWLLLYDSKFLDLCLSLSLSPESRRTWSCRTCQCWQQGTFHTWLSKRRDPLQAWLCHTCWDLHRRACWESPSMSPPCCMGYISTTPAPGLPFPLRAYEAAYTQHTV